VFEENKAGERRFRESPRARDVATKNNKHSSAKKGKEKMPQEYKQEASGNGRQGAVYRIENKAHTIGKGKLKK
jgi:hypothetical protein